MGLLPNRPLLLSHGSLHLPPRSLQPSRIRSLRTRYPHRPVLLHSRRITDDVRTFLLPLKPLLTTLRAEFVKARNAFHSAGMSASLGTYAFGWTWGAWAALLLATIFLFLGCGAGGRKERGDNVRSTNGTGSGYGNVGFFGRQRSKKSTRGSLIDNESQRRVKDEYA